MPSDGANTTLEQAHVRETYRYLRIGLIGATALLAIAVLIERFQVDCWQGSISAYYFTPARSVFVGVLIAVGLVLIVIKGTGFEDLFLNLAGMLAPVVALVPTTSIGACWSVKPEPYPLASVRPPVLADWVTANIDNNMWALIAAGFLGLILAFLLYRRTGESFLWPFELGEGNRAALWGMILVGVIIGGTAIALSLWDDFALRAHDAAAIGMFVFLAAASISNARRTTVTRYKRTYWLIASLMVAAAVVIWLVTLAVDDWGHSIFWLEVIEIGLFAAYWIAQTAEHWDETVSPGPATT